jgi:transcription antitermination factor NusG
MLPLSAEHWYIAYTLPRHEKAISLRLKAVGVACYVPLYLETRTWSGRSVKLELPLFPCYVFARTVPQDRYRLLSTPGLIRLLAVNGSPVLFPDEEMDALQSALRSGKARPCSLQSSGNRIRLKSGPFAGLEGTIQRHNGKRKLLVTLDQISSSMLLDIDVAEAQLLVSSVKVQTRDSVGNL